MKAVGLLWKLLIVCLLLLSGRGALANFVTSNSDTFGNKALVTDTQSGLTWLNLDLTSGLSFNSVAALLLQDADYANVRFASLGEVDGLFSDAGFSVNGPTGNMSDRTRLKANASFAKSFVGLASKGSEMFRGYTDEPGFPIDPAHGVYRLQVAGVGVTHGSKTAAIAFDDETGYFSSQAYAGVGSWLIYEAPSALADGSSIAVPGLSAVSPVPEPSAWALMLIGLLALSVSMSGRRHR